MSGPDFWSDPSEQKKNATPSNELEASKPSPVAADAPGGFWQPASEKAITNKETARKGASEKPPTKPRRLLKKAILITSGTLIGLLILALIFAPRVAAAYAKTLVVGFDGPSGGTLTIKDADLSWSGPQSIGPIVLVDKEKNQVAKVSLKAETSILDAAMGGRNFGTITVSGDIRIIRNKDGTLNIIDATQNKQDASKSTTPPSPGKAEPIIIPADLAAKLVLKDLKIVYDDYTPGGTSIDVRDLNMTADLRTGKPITIDLDASLRAADQPPSRIAVKASLDGWSNKQGKVADLSTPEGLNALQIDSQVSLTDLPTTVIDGLAQQGGALARTIGPRLGIELKAKGSLKDATASLATTAQNLIAKGELAAKDGTVRIVQPIELGVRGAALAAYVPQDQTSAAQIKEFPDVAITIPMLSMKVPQSGAMDWRGASARVAITTTRAAGEVMLGEQRKAFEVKPLNVTVDVPDLAQGATIKGGTSATIGGAPAGDLTIDIAAAGLLDDKGELKATPARTFRADVALASVQTAIAQAFMPKDTIDLTKDVGPTLDARVVASTTALAKDAPEGTLPPTTAEFSIKSAQINATGALALTENRVKNTSPITISVASASSIAARFIKDAAGWNVSPGGGTMKIDIDGVDVPLKLVKNMDKASGVEASTYAPDAPATKARATTTLANFAALAPAGSTVDLQSFTLTTNLAGNGSARAEVRGSLAHGGQNATIDGSFDIADLIGAMDQPGGPVQADKMKPKGSLAINGVPASLIGAAVKQGPTTPGQKPMDLAALARAVLGPTVDTTITAAAAEPINNAAAYTIGARVTSQRLNVASGATVAPGQRADVQALTATLNLEPQTATDVMRALGQDVSKLPTLAHRSTVQVSTQPISIPLTSTGPDFDKAGSLAADVSIPGAMLVNGLTMPGKDATGRDIVRDLGPVGVQDVKVSLRAPAGVLGTSGGDATASLNADVLDGPRSMIASLSANVKLPMKNGGPSGDGVAIAKIKNVLTSGLDRILNQGNLVSGALGDRVDIDATVPLLMPPTDIARPDTLARNASPTAELMATSPRLRMNRPLRISMGSDAIRVLEPVAINWTGDAAWLTRFTAPDGPGAANALRITKPVDVRVAINALSLGKPGPLMPGVFVADLAVDVPSVEVEDAKGQRVRLRDVSLKANRDLAGAIGQSDPTAIGFELGVASAIVGDAPPTKDILIRGLAARLATPSGDFDAKQAQFNVNGQVPALPTALVDTLANQNGLLEEALGPVIECNVQAEKFTLAGSEPGRVEASMKSKRAQASLKGTIANGSFTATQPLQVSLNEITKELGNRFIKGVPFVGELSKSGELAPATVNAPALSVPLGNDMSKLNGDVAIDPGELLFKPSKDFAALLKALNQNTSGGLMGQRLQPLQLAIRNGVITYQKWTLPLGQFNIQTEGVVDLVAQRVDVVTWIPFGALSSAAAGALGATAMAGLDDSFQVPYRTLGPLSSPRTGPDSELLAKQLLNNKSLEKVIEKGLGELFKKPAAPGVPGATPTAPGLPGAVPPTPAPTPPVTPTP